MFTPAGWSGVHSRGLPPVVGSLAIGPKGGATPMTNLTISLLAQNVQSTLAQAAPDHAPEERAELADAIALQLAAQAPPPDGVPAAGRERRIDNDLFSNVAYAIPDEALNLLPSIVQAAVGAYAKGPIGAIADLVGLLVRYRSLRVEISPDEAAVLRELRDAKKAGQATLAPAEVQSRLQAEGLVLRQPVGEVFASLLAKKTEKATLVREVNGRWAIGNV
jgi:hypothetical protein